MEHRIDHEKQSQNVAALQGRAANLLQLDEQFSVRSTPSPDPPKVNTRTSSVVPRSHRVKPIPPISSQFPPAEWESTSQPERAKLTKTETPSFPPPSWAETEPKKVDRQS